jgi:hypothetical protein
MIGSLLILTMALLIFGSAFPATYTDPDEF